MTTLLDVVVTITSIDRGIDYLVVTVQASASPALSDGLNPIFIIGMNYTMIDIQDQISNGDDVTAGFFQGSFDPMAEFDTGVSFIYKCSLISLTFIHRIPVCGRILRLSHARSSILLLD